VLAEFTFGHSATQLQWPSLLNREHFSAFHAFGDLDKIRLMLDDILSVERLIPITSDGGREELVVHLAQFTREVAAVLTLSPNQHTAKRCFGRADALIVSRDGVLVAIVLLHQSELQFGIRKLAHHCNLSLNQSLMLQ
jgi:hypothetical protein